MEPATFGPELGTETATVATATVADDQISVLAAHMAAAETATLSTQVDTLTAERATLTAEVARLTSELEVATAARAAAELAITEAAAAAARETELAALVTTRADAVREISPTLLEGEEAAVSARTARWAAMEQAVFDSFLEDIRAVSPAVTSTGSFTAASAETATATARTSTTAAGDNPAAALAKGI